jgi:hypothetical protein
MKNTVNKWLGNAKKWWKSTSWLKKLAVLLRFVYKLAKIVKWLQVHIPTILAVVDKIING